MDRPLEKKHPLLRYKYPIAGAVLFIAFLIYVIIFASGSKKIRINRESVATDTVTENYFLEYVDIEGIVQPILTIKVNATENGTVEEIIGEEGCMIEKGDTILRLSNPALMRDIADQQDEWEKQLTGYQEKEIEMEQKRLNLKQQILQNNFELKRLRKNFELDKEEYKMGVKSKAQLEVSEDEYKYNLEKTRLQSAGLKQDSMVSIIRRDLIRNDLKREKKKFERTKQRLDNLMICSPIAGQLSFINVTPGQQITAGQNIGEIKITDQFKIHTQISEFYIDRIVTGLPAIVNYQNHKYPLRITKVVPEVKDRLFAVDLVFTGEKPANIRIGKNYRVQIELGQPEQSLVIKKGNFFQYTSGKWIYKMEKRSNRAVRVPISVGRQNPLQYEIMEGLSVGDRVIISGYENFGDAKEVIIK